MSATVRRGEVFRYESYEIDSGAGLLSCRYSLDGRKFEERFTLSLEGCWDAPEVAAAARLVFLLAGVSYYKTAAPPVVDLHEQALTELERSLLRSFYTEGLGEFAYCNNLDLSDLIFRSRSAPAGAGSAYDEIGVKDSARNYSRGLPRQPVLVPFGGGIDSIVTVEGVRRRADVALFVMNRPGDRFDGIEAPAALAGLPVVRAEREIDSQMLRSRELGFLHGHVPVTGILSAVAVLAAVLDRREAVVMSNEWSASVPTLEHNGRPVNHQWSKSAAFEAAFRSVLAAQPAVLPDYFSALRDRTELWVAEKFASLESYHSTFRSCNKAFPLDKARRLDHWCGQCDKCCFIDLILAPFMPARALRAVFAGEPEPLSDAALAPKFRALLGSGNKPFECVGEIRECRAAVLLAARRTDRADCGLLQDLAAEVACCPDAPADAEIAAMRRPVGKSFVPTTFAL